MLASTLFEVTLSPGIWCDGVLEYLEITIKDVENPEDVRHAFYLNDGTLHARLANLVSVAEATEFLAGIRRDETICLSGHFTRQQLLDMNAYQGALRVA
jgi:hypothetical protein